MIGRQALNLCLLLLLGCQQQAAAGKHSSVPSSKEETTAQNRRAGKLVTFKDWVVGCDNTLTCRAIGLPKDPRDSEFRIVVERGAGANAVPKIWINTWHRGEELPPPPTKLLIDEQTIALTPLPDSEFISRVAPVDSLAFLAALASGRRLVLLNEEGRRIALGFEEHLPLRESDVSPDGAKAALRYLDDRQGRAGTVTALVAKGPAPASTVPAPPSPPVIRLPPASTKAPFPIQKALAMARPMLKKELDDSDEEQCPGFLAEHATSYRLDATHSLILLFMPCGVEGSGGYTSYVVLIADDAKPDRLQRVTFPMLRTYSDDDGTVLDNAEWYPEDRTLATSECNYHRTYVWDGRSFRLSEWSEIDQCQGTYSRIFSDLITQWRARVVQ